MGIIWQIRLHDPCFWQCGPLPPLLWPLFFIFLLLIPGKWFRYWHWTTAVFRSVAEIEHEEIPIKEVVEESELVTSASSPVSVDASQSTNCDEVKVQSDSDRVSTTSPGDARPPTEPETCTLEDHGSPCVSSKEASAAESLQVVSKPEDGHAPSGLVAFCQSDSSAFTTFITAKHASSPVVIQGCDRRLRGASYRQSVSSTPDYDDPTPGHSPQSHDSDQPYCGSDEASQTSVESQVSECDVAASSKLSAAAKCFTGRQFAVYEDPVYIPDGCNEGAMAPYPPCVPVPVPAIPPRPPCYYPPMPRMSYPYQPYMNSATPCYSSGVSIIQHCPYPMMPPSGMMPPAGMMPMAYPPLPPAAPRCPTCAGSGSCYPPYPSAAPCCQPYPVPAPCPPPYPNPAPYWVPSSVMYRPMLARFPAPMQPELPCFPAPMQPELPWWCWTALFKKHCVCISAEHILDFYCYSVLHCWLHSWLSLQRELSRYHLSCSCLYFRSVVFIVLSHLLCDTSHMLSL